MSGFGADSVYSSAVTVGWTLMENMKFVMQGWVNIGVLLWKPSCRHLLMLEYYCRNGGLLCEGLSVRCSEESESAVQCERVKSGQFVHTLQFNLKR